MKVQPLGTWIAIGAAIGVTIGVITEELALWLGIGVALGAAIGAGALRHCRNTDNDRRR